MRIKVMADYGCAPLWWNETERVGNLTPEDLNLSTALASELWDWAAEYDATFNRDDPLNSTFPSVEAERDFDRRGRRLAKRVAEEVIGSTVQFWRDL